MKIKITESQYSFLLNESKIEGFKKYIFRTHRSTNKG
jgi:hypothetical protein